MRFTHHRLARFGTGASGCPQDTRTDIGQGRRGSGKTAGHESERSHRSGTADHVLLPRNDRVTNARTRRETGEACSLADRTSSRVRARRLPGGGDHADRFLGKYGGISAREAALATASRKPSGQSAGSTQRLTVPLV